MNEDMTLQLVFAVEGLRASSESLERTRVRWAIGRVDEKMTVELVFAGELFATLFTLVILDAQMHALLVLRELRSASEAAVTAFVVTNVALNAGMRLLVLRKRVLVTADLVALVAWQVVQDLLAVSFQGFLRVELLLAVHTLVLARVGRLVGLTHVLAGELQETYLALENVFKLFLVLVQVLFAHERPLTVVALVELLVHELMDHEGFRTVKYFVANVALERTGHPGQCGLGFGSTRLRLLGRCQFGFLFFRAIFCFCRVK